MFGLVNSPVTSLKQDDALLSLRASRTASRKQPLHLKIFYIAAEIREYGYFQELYLNLDFHKIFFTLQMHRVFVYVML